MRSNGIKAIRDDARGAPVTSGMRRNARSGVTRRSKKRAHGRGDRELVRSSWKARRHHSRGDLERRILRGWRRSYAMSVAVGTSGRAIARVGGTVCRLFETKGRAVSSEVFGHVHGARDLEREQQHDHAHDQKRRAPNATEAAHFVRTSTLVVRVRDHRVRQATSILQLVK